MEAQSIPQSPQTTGLAAGDWRGFGADCEMPLDQREDDGKSLSIHFFDSAVLEQILGIFGAPVVTPTLATDRPQGLQYV